MFNIKVPCYTCDERNENCHSECGRYLAYKNDLAKVKAKHAGSFQMNLHPGGVAYKKRKKDGRTVWYKTYI